MDTSRTVDQYVLTSVTFGDRPSGAIPTSAMRMTANLYEEEYLDAAKLVRDGSYVDNLLGSVDRYPEATRLMQDTQQLLQQGGFQIKHWIVPKRPGEAEKEIGHVVKITTCPSEKILAVIWLSVEDVFQYKVNINFGQKGKCNERRFFDSNAEQNNTLPNILASRMVVSQLNKMFDRLG